MRNPKYANSKLPITVAIPVKNEEANLGQCLERLDRFSEIIVIDSGSTDRTQEIARDFGARIVNFKWDGFYPKKRNWFLLNEKISNQWILFLDADEYVDFEFCNYLTNIIDDDEFDGFWIEYNNYFISHKLKYGLMQRKLSLFRFGKALYERIDESNWSDLDMEVHEHPVVTGRVGKIPVRIDHRDFKGIAHFIAKHLEYARWEAHRHNSLHDDPDAWSNLTFRQKIKYRYLSKSWYPIFYFIFTYIVKLGLLDKRAGYYYAFYKTWYFKTIRLLIKEL